MSDIWKTSWIASNQEQVYRWNARVKKMNTIEGTHPQENSSNFFGELQKKRIFMDNNFHGVTKTKKKQEYRGNTNKKIKHLKTANRLGSKSFTH